MLPGSETRFQVLQSLIYFAYLHVHDHKLTLLHLRRVRRLQMKP